MTTEALTPPVAPVVVVAPVAPPVVAPPDGTVADLTAKLAEANARAGTFAQQVATLTGERDTFKSQIADLAPRAAQAAELAVKVTDLTNMSREAAFVDALRGKLPGADPLAIRGVLGELAKAGKINRYPEAVDIEVAKAVPIITAEAPSLTRPLTAGGGTPGARQTPPASGRKSLVG